MDRLVKANHGKAPRASLILKELSALKYHGLNAQLLSQKIKHLKKKFTRAVNEDDPKLCRDRALYEISMKLWPELSEKAEAARRKQDINGSTA